MIRYIFIIQDCLYKILQIDRWVVFIIAVEIKVSYALLCETPWIVFVACNKEHESFIVHENGLIEGTGKISFDERLIVHTEPLLILLLLSTTKDRNEVTISKKNSGLISSSFFSTWG